MAIFPDTFLDYLPAPPGGETAWQAGLRRSFDSGQPQVAPLHALLKITNRCGSNCVYCSHSGVSDTHDEAPLELLLKVVDQIAEAGAISVNFTGGEPLLRDDLPQLIDHARKRNLFPILLTNGLILKRWASRLAGVGLGMLIVSVDSMDPDRYREVRGSPLGPVLEALDAVKQLRRAGTIVTVTTVITNCNVEHLDPIVEHFGPRGIGVQFCPHHHHGRWENDRFSPHNQKQYGEAIQRLKQLKDQGAGVLNSHAYLDGFLDFNFHRRKLPHGYRCYCGYSTLFIDYRMNVRSCWSAGLPVVGNLLESSLSQILESKPMEEVRRRISRLRCEHCWLLCTSEISLRWQ